jgi:hypothetical protein
MSEEILCNKVEVKVSLEQATKGSRGIAVLFL